jgi:hypothetical protein
MAGIYLAKAEAELGSCSFHLGDRPLSEIVGQFGVKPEDREPAMPEALQPEEPLLVVISVPEDEAEGTAFEAGYYRAAITPHRAMRHCGIGLSDILGAGLAPMQQFSDI